MIKWQKLVSKEELAAIMEKSNDNPQVIFKHSTTCPISSMAKNRIESSWDIDLEPYYLDLLSYRPISNAIASDLEVEHQSPQIIVINKGKAIYNESHLDINVQDIKSAIAN